MALFGAPIAHEDHAVRACYAALRHAGRRCAATPMRCGGPTACPCTSGSGLNSGEVVVRAIGSDLHMDYTAVGQTTHLAARMEQLATPGTILITAETLGLGRGLRRRSSRWARCRVRGLARRRWRSLSWSGASASAPTAASDRGARAHPLRRTRRLELDDAAPGAGAGWGGPWPGGGAGRRARRGEVAPGLRVHPLPPHARAGWCSRAARSPTARRPRTSRCIDLLKALLPDRRADDDARTASATR